MQSILLCVDGEPHTEKALRHALMLAGALAAKLTALYVVDPYLKKFTHEIYAVNREACRAHLDRALEAEGAEALAGFGALAAEAGIGFETRMLHGDPAAVIAALAAQEGFELVVAGGKALHGWRQRFESRNLPERLNRLLGCPLLIVR